MRSLALAFLLPFLAAALGALSAPAQARAFTQPELDALLAPVALYPDELVDDVLVAAAYPDQVTDAARGVAAQPHWHPSVVALARYPGILQRMAESPQWMRELSEAFIYQQASVMQTIQALRSRAQAYGHLPEPQREVVYVRYYDPLVAYGGWWWHSHPPHFWRPWHAHRAFSGHKHHALPASRHVHTPRRHGMHVTAPVLIPESKRRPIVSSTPQISHRQWRAPAHAGGRHHKQRR